MRTFGNESRLSVLQPLAEPAAQASETETGLRPEALSQGQLLLDDPGYPGDEVIADMADLLAELLG